MSITPPFIAEFSHMHRKRKNDCAGTGVSLPVLAHGISMKLISKLMAVGLTCTGLLTAKAAPSIFISLHVVTAKLHIVFSGRF